MTDRGCSPNDLTNQIVRDGPHPVASGGFADIHRGMLQHNRQSIKVAIKAIKSYTEEGGFRKKEKRLRRELKVWLDLRHENVLQLLGTTMGFGQFPAMVCPWVENGSLTSYLEQRYQSLSASEILTLLDNVASGMHYLHSRSIVHGDLSGSNVLIREDGRACIADFGLSMLLTELGGSTFATSFHARGTLRWTAPELLDLEVHENGMEEESLRIGPTTQSDVYSFGRLMLQILSGKIPYHYYKREVQVLHAISKGRRPAWPKNTLVTHDRWVFMKQCWTGRFHLRADPRPSSEEIVAFIKEELATDGESDDTLLHFRSHSGPSAQRKLHRTRITPTSPRSSELYTPSLPYPSRVRRTRAHFYNRTPSPRLCPDGRQTHSIPISGPLDPTAITSMDHPNASHTCIHVLPWPFNDDDLVSEGKSNPNMRTKNVLAEILPRDATRRNEQERTPMLPPLEDQSDSDTSSRHSFPGQSNASSNTRQDPPQYKKDYAPCTDMAFMEFMYETFARAEPALW